MSNAKERNAQNVHGQVFAVFTKLEIFLKHLET